MAVESKPLFHPEVIRRHLRSFILPPSVEESLPKLQLWADRINSGEADKLKETELLPDFLTDIFGTLLGYTGPISGGDHYTLSREKLVEVYGEFADAVLGRFSHGKRQFIVALEGKDTRNPLDRPHAGRRLSAVEQPTIGTHKTGTLPQRAAVAFRHVRTRKSGALSSNHCDRFPNRQGSLCALWTERGEGTVCRRKHHQGAVAAEAGSAEVMNAPAALPCCRAAGFVKCRRSRRKGTAI